MNTIDTMDKADKEIIGNARHFNQCTAAQRDMVRSGDYLVRVEAAKQSLAPEEGMKDDNEFVRMTTVFNSAPYLQKTATGPGSLPYLDKRIKKGASLMIAAIHDKSPHVRRAAAKMCKVSQLKQLSGDNDDAVMIEIIKRSSKKECARLIDAGSQSLWLFLAQHVGGLSYDSLVRKNCKEVKLIIAEKGSAVHRDTLTFDSSVDVRIRVARFGGDRHLEVLKKDSNELVRAAVVKYGDERHWNYLTNDSSVAVQRERLLKVPDDQTSSPSMG